MARSRRQRKPEESTAKRAEGEDVTPATRVEASSPPPSAPPASLAIRTKHPKRSGYIACGRVFGPRPVVLPREELGDDALARLEADPLLVVEVC